MKRKLTLSLALMLLALTAAQAVACGDSTDKKGNDTTASSSGNDTTTAEETTAKSLLDDLGDKDFGGRTFTFLDANGNPAAHVNIPADEETGETINDLLYQRDSVIEDKYNVKLDYVQIANANDGCATLKNSVLAGDNDYDFVMSNLMSGGLGSIATDGVLANLLDTPYLSLSDKWWSHYMYDNLQLEGRMYYTTGDITPTLYQMPACVYINRSLLDKYNIDTNFYELVTTGKWTVDELYSLTRDKDEDLNQDGVMSDQDDFFGFAPQMQTLMTESLLVGAGVDLSGLNADKTDIVLDFSSERTQNVFTKLQQVVPHNITFEGYSVDTGKVFSEDRALVTMHFVEKAINTFRSMNSDYYILPVPKYDETQDGYRSFVNAWINAFSAIPANADLEFSGFITEALARYSYEVIRPRAYDITYKAKATRDDESAEMLDIIFDNVYLDFNAIYDFSGMMNAFNSVLVDQTPLASTLASKLTSAQTQAEKLVQNWVD